MSRRERRVEGEREAYEASLEGLASFMDMPLWRPSIKASSLRDGMKRSSFPRMKSSSSSVSYGDEELFIHWSKTSPTLFASSCVKAQVVPFSACSLSSSESVLCGLCLLGELSRCEELRGSRRGGEEGSALGVV